MTPHQIERCDSDRVPFEGAAQLAVQVNAAGMIGARSEAFTAALAKWLDGIEQAEQREKASHVSRLA